MINPYFKKRNYWVIRKITLCCFAISGLFLFLSQPIKAATCIPGAGDLNINSVSVNGSYLDVSGNLTAGECDNHCLTDPPDYEDGLWAVEDPVADIQYQIDSSGWSSLTRGLNEQWDLTTGAKPTYCVIEHEFLYQFSPAEYSIAAFGSDGIPHLQTGGTHTLYLRAFIDAQIIGQDSVNFNVDVPPDIPVLISPPHNTWINSTPTFQAEVYDFNEGDTVAAVFEVVGYNAGGSIGSFLIDNGPGVSSWGPVAIDDGDWWWRAWAIDNNGSKSPETDYWLTRKDTIAPTVMIDQENGISADTDIAVRLIEADERSGVREGDVDVSWRLISNPTWGNWVNTDLPNSGSTTDDFVYPGVRGYEYRFRYRVSDNAGNWSDYVYDGTVAIPFNSSPTVSDLSFSNSDFCSSSPAYFFSWVYSDPESDNQSRFDFQIDDSGVTFPSPEVNRSYSGLSNPSPTINNQAVTVLINQQAGHLTYNRTYNWRVRVYDSNNLDSGWVNGAVFTTPSHRSPVCNFSWSPVNPKPNELTDFFDSSTCYDTGGNVIPCVGWNWTFIDGDPAVSTQRNPSTKFLSSGTKNVTLEVTDSFGSVCSLTGQVIVNLLPGRWKEIKP